MNLKIVIFEITKNCWFKKYFIFCYIFFMKYNIVLRFITTSSGYESHYEGYKYIRIYILSFYHER